MSLINDVLRDLEKRERAAPATVQAAFATTPATGRHSILGWGILAGLLLLLCSLMLWWLWPTPAPSAPATEAVNPLPQIQAVSAAPAEPQPLPPRERQLERQLEQQPEQQSERRLSDPQPEPVANVTQITAPATPPSSATLSAVPPSAALTRPATAVQTVTTAADSSSVSIQIRRRSPHPEASAPPSKTALASLEQVQVDLDQGLQQRAAERLNRLLQTQPHHTHARLLLARLYLHQHRAQEALQLLQANAGDAPQPDFDLLLAASLRESGRHTQATELYQQLTRQYPDSPQARLGLALSQEAAERWQAATDNYRLLLNTPDPRTRRLASQRLRVLHQRASEATATDSPPSAQPSTRERTNNP